MQKGKKFLSDLKLHSDYLKWNENLGRYETWEEACEDIIKCHLEKYGDKIKPYSDSALQSMKEKLVLASQRTLQYRGEQLKSHNSRLYNCTTGYVAYNKLFQEVFYLLLSGCGFGGGLLLPFVKNLSNITKRNKGTKTFIVPDSIEGWSDSLGVLMSSYFVDEQPFPEYFGYEIKFDFSQIRKKGSFISGGFKAPGSEALQKSLEQIENLIENWLKMEGGEIRPILAFDILCFTSNAVLSGGVRRSAMNMIIDENDQEMINAKMGNWFETNPQRARSNNSILLLRDKVNKTQFEEIVKMNDGISDIGFVFANSYFDMFNPCFTGDMEVLTKNGYKKFSEFEENKIEKFINGVGEEVDGFVKKSGIKKVFDIKLTNNKVITSTENHIFLNSDGVEIEAINLIGEKLEFFLDRNQKWNNEYLKYGFLQGDSCLSRLKSEAHKGIEVCFNKKDFELCELFGVEQTMTVYINGYNDILRELKFSDKSLPERVLPEDFNEWGDIESRSFLRGLWSANGSVIKAGRIALKSTCRSLISQLENELNKLGIINYVTTNKAKSVTFKNGNYVCKESYDLNISKYESVVKFYNLIGFHQTYKTESIEKLIKDKAPKVKSITPRKNLEVVYDFELNDLTHIGVVEGVLAHNCYEISQLPILWDNTMDLENIKYGDLYNFVNKNKHLLGIQACNLCEISAEACTTKEKFFRACYDASILGTIQAGWTSFPYLGNVTENIIRKESLLGVSITGWMNNPKLFNPELLQKGVDIIRDTNIEVSNLIGINPAARLTCCKPSGNSSVILGTSSGIHPEHSQQYFRIMQLNKEAETAKWLNTNMSFLLEDSVWSENKSDYVVFIPIENSKDGLYKKDMTGLAHLEKIKLVQENWVAYGTNKELCGYKNINHNVSSTVIIDDVEDVINYIWDNRNDFTAVSFISNTADREYNQAPFTTVNTLENIIETHGKGSLFASGLIVDGLHHFKNNLWLACDSVLDKSIPVVGTREEVLLKKYWISCAKKFAKNYFKGDLKKMVYCLKDVHLFHKWEVINRQMREVDFNKILAKPTFKDVADYAAQACSGGACEIRRV